MTAIAGRSQLALFARACRNPAMWMTAADVCTILLAAALPWSTSLVAIFAVAMVVVMAPLFEIKAFLLCVKRPGVAVPVVFFLLALTGTLWSPAPWAERFHGIGPTLKLLMLPLLFYHFERSERGRWIFIAFLVSCVLLSVMSWIVAFHPDLSLKPRFNAAHGIFVKDYIDQSQEFTLCVMALAYPIIALVRARKVRLALPLCAIALTLLANMMFVIVSRTALVTMPIMAAVFGLLHLRWRTNLMILAASIAVVAAAWAVSPQFDVALERFSQDYRFYKKGIPSSTAERLEYWTHALTFLADAPLIGNGTGSTKQLYEQAARSPEWGVGIRVFPNPHNQTLAVAIQWGVLGIAALYAMWLVHLLMFRGDGFANWIGLLVVVQNIFTSLFNSHIFDFHEGWMYVLGVGVAGGMVLKARAGGEAPDAAGS